MRALVLAPLLALVVAACAPGAQQQPAQGPGGARVIQLELSEFAFKPASITLKAGETVTLKITNKGAVEHELAAGRQAQATEGGFKEDFFKGVQLKLTGLSPISGHEGSGVKVDPGKSGEVTFTVPDKKGSYEIGCFIPGHYVSGMKGTLVVQ